MNANQIIVNEYNEAFGLPTESVELNADPAQELISIHYNPFNKLGGKVGLAMLADPRLNWLEDLGSIDDSNFATEWYEVVIPEEEDPSDEQDGRPLTPYHFFPENHPARIVADMDFSTKGPKGPTPPTSELEDTSDAQALVDEYTAKFPTTVDLGIVVNAVDFELHIHDVYGDTDKLRAALLGDARVEIVGEEGDSDATAILLQTAQIDEWSKYRKIAEEFDPKVAWVQIFAAELHDFITGEPIKWALVVELKFGFENSREWALLSKKLRHVEGLEVEMNAPVIGAYYRQRLVYSFFEL